MSSRKRHSFIPLKNIPERGVLAVTSPATTPNTDNLERGVHYLESVGYRVEVGQSCYNTEYYVAGDDASRADELMRFIENPNIDAIICSRGGYGSMRLLPLLDYDLIKEKRKPLIGFSDITALQWGIYARCGLPSISGGMVATDMARIPVNQSFEEAFWQFLQTGTFSYHISTNFLKNKQKVVPESIKGICMPGTVSLISKLLGTPYMPKIDNPVYVLEDVDEPTHKIEAYLMHLLLGGLFNQSKAVVTGQFLKSEREPYPAVPSLSEVFETVFKGCRCPVFKGVSYGHIPGKIPFPVGAPVLLSLGIDNLIQSAESIFEY